MGLRTLPTSSSLLFLASVVFGILLYLPLYNFRMKRLFQPSAGERIAHQVRYKDWILAKNISKVPLDPVDFSNHNYIKVMKESDYLKQQVPLVCAIIIKDTGASFSEAIYKTWGQRCPRTLYFTTTYLQSIPAQDQVVLTSSRDIQSWTALREITRYLHTQSELKAYNWFYLVAEETYVVVENLLYYLCVLKSMDAYYVGHLMRQMLVSYNALGPGFVLSQMALRKLNNALLKGQCSNSNVGGEIGLGSCLSEVGVFGMDTRDHVGRGRFLMYPPESLLVPGILQHAKNFWDNSVYLSPDGPDCCSDHAISFYNMDVNKIYVMEYLINSLRPYHSPNTTELKSSPQRQETQPQQLTIEET